MTALNASDFASLQQALTACAAAVKPVTLTVPAGTYRSGPLTLCSDLTVHLEKGARILFDDDPHSYFPAVKMRWEGVECFAMHPLIYGCDLHDVVIEGDGVIDGCGLRWWQLFEEIKKEDRTVPRYDYELELAKLNAHIGPRASGGGRPSTQFLRPPLVQFANCTGVRMDGVTVQNSPFWTLHCLYCSGVELLNLTVFNPESSPNTDAVDIDSCSNTRIENCLFDVGDDAVTLKAGSGPDGLKIGLPTCHVKVKNCTVKKSHGGIAIGSETAGGIFDVRVEDCRFEGTQRAVRIKTRRGRGGNICDIALKNLTVDDSICPIAFNAFYTPGLEEEEKPAALSTNLQEINPLTPSIGNVRIENVTASNVTGAPLFMAGLPESPIRQVEIKNYRWSLAPDSKLVDPALCEFTGGLFFEDGGREPKIINVEDFKFD